MGGPGRLRIRAVVIEDEPLARRYLVELLGRTDRVEVVGVAGDGREGFRLIAEATPDVAFLDVQVPGPDGLELAARLPTLPRPPLVVFVTAFADHAVAAFAVEAVDFLVKPIDPDLVRRAVHRLERRLGFAEAVEADPAEDRLPVRILGGEAVRLIPRAEIFLVRRHRRRTWVHTHSEQLATAQPLAVLSDGLGGPPFLQVARDAIVNMGRVVEVLRTGDRLYRLRLADRPGTLVETSRSGTARLNAYLNASR